MFSTYKKATGKSVLFLLALAGAALFAACEKEEATRNVELPFTRETGDDRLAFPILQTYVDDPSVKNIYLVAEGDWSMFYANQIAQTRTRFFQPRIELSTKIHGRGDFNFEVGEASKVPSDSLWFVQHGWTINKALQNQE